MRNWNVIVTVHPGWMREREVLGELKQLADFQASDFKDVCIGRVEDVRGFLEAIRSYREARARWALDLARVIPVETTFPFAADTLTQKLKDAVSAFAPRMQSGSFHVRVERRGLAGKLPTQEIERAVAEHLFDLAEREGRKLSVSFDDPDFIVAAETLGAECGVALLAREMRQRYPFVQTR